MIQHGGLVYYGGFIGAAVAGIIYILWKKMPLWKTADVLAPSIALGSVFGRTGCLLNGCCYGRANGSCRGPSLSPTSAGAIRASPATPTRIAAGCIRRKFTTRC